MNCTSSSISHNKPVDSIQNRDWVCEKPQRCCTKSDLNVRYQKRRSAVKNFKINQNHTSPCGGPQGRGYLVGALAARPGIQVNLL